MSKNAARQPTHLDLRANSLSELPKEISQLGNLTHLDLSENSLSELPKEISQLGNLTYSWDLRANSP
ncbi:MAG: hypothetical protein R2880_14640 [Deinococcales bacterium]